MPILPADLKGISRDAFQGQYQGLLLHGSWARGHADETSDVDLIYVTSRGAKQQYASTIRGVQIDVYAAPEASLLGSIEEDKPDNNNFLLEAFVHGQPLEDSNGGIRRLMSRAAAVWERGPVRPSYSEQKSLASAIHRSCATTRRLCIRAAESKLHSEITALATAQCARLFFRLLYAYCRSHRLWASSVPGILAWSDERYFELQQFCHAYLKAESLKSTMTILENLAAEAAKPLTGDCIALARNDVGTSPR